MRLADALWLNSGRWSPSSDCCRLPALPRAGVEPCAPFARGRARIRRRTGDQVHARPDRADGDSPQRVLLSSSAAKRCTASPSGTDLRFQDVAGLERHRRNRTPFESGQRLRLRPSQQRSRVGDVASARSKASGPSGAAAPLRRQRAAPRRESAAAGVRCRLSWRWPAESGQIVGRTSPANKPDRASTSPADPARPCAPPPMAWWCIPARAWSATAS